MEKIIELADIQKALAEVENIGKMKILSVMRVLV